MTDLKPQLAHTDEEIRRCFPVMAQLRPHLAEAEFVPLVREMQNGGFQLAYICEEAEVVAVAGFRIGRNLFMGRHLYVDDLVSDESARSRGHGRLLLDWLKQLAASEGCQHIHLDSGTHRHRAHKFYLNRGYDIASYHFSQKIEH